jgi:glutamyl-Q tRNA(Asp) synthetase
MRKNTTRFAPSPTGHLHIGHAFAALTAASAARDTGGQFLLRIEDIDHARCRPAFDEAIRDDLSWLGIRWDGEVRRQSEHFSDYETALAKLGAQDLLYPCFCTRKEVEAEIARAGAAPHGPEGALYPGTCRDLTANEREARLQSGSSFALRLHVKAAIARAGQDVFFTENGLGPEGQSGIIAAQPALLGDVVLARKDMPASYHLAVVVDDALQGVTLVTRGNDLFFATHLQRLLQALLGLAAPAYAHHALLLDKDGKKFSKRDHAVTIRALREAGRTPSDVKAMAGF